jgi:hypothetical protein
MIETPDVLEQVEEERREERAVYTHAQEYPPR